MFKKIGESLEIGGIEQEIAPCLAAIDSNILENFKKIAIELKQVAPKADDFLYFSAVMMHAAENSSINDDGSPKLTKGGIPVVVGWDKSNGTWKWKTNDPLIQAYKNSNFDIFPEEQLILAHKKWIGKPLCIDHKSSSVDHVRGFIVDTYYDHLLKRVVALCALDKKNYPDLARKVATGYSTCVSMGVGVGRAICYDCGKVARAEHEFCNHMKYKNSYGEINIDLNPIELSIVVNGADPKAHIKHVIASARQNIKSYFEMKKMNKFAKSFSAEVSFYNENQFDSINKKENFSCDNFEDLKNNLEKSLTSAKEDEKECGSLNLTLNDIDNNENQKTFSLNVSAKNLDSFEKMLNVALEKLQKASEDEDKTNEDKKDDKLALDVPASSDVDNGLAPPHEKFARNVLKDLQKVANNIESKLNNMKTDLNKLSNGDNMNKKGYFNGTEEPKPGQVQYPADPLNEKLRNTEDKQMVGEKPFPEVGDPSGLYGDDLERKRMLARAEHEERALVRKAVVDLAKEALMDRKAYFQGGGDVNEPTPGKVKYQKDKLNEEDRNKADKQMVGEKPFPGVGDPSGLYPDDLKKKEMMNRASYSAKFFRVANRDGSPNLGHCFWNVYDGENIVLSASVNELSGNQPELFFNYVRTEPFAQDLIKRVKKEGADRVKSSLRKEGQAAPASMPAQPPTAAPAAPPAPEGAPNPVDQAMQTGQGELDETLEKDMGKDGDPKAKVVDLAEKANDATSDLLEAARSLTNEQVEMGAMEAPKTAELKTMRDIHKTMGAELLESLKEQAGKLMKLVDELNTYAEILEDKKAVKSNKEMLDSVVEESVAETKTALVEALGIKRAYIKYVEGVKLIQKRAHLENQLYSLGDHDLEDKSGDESDERSEFLKKLDDVGSEESLMDLIEDSNADLKVINDMMAQDGMCLDDGDDENDLMAKKEELKNLEVKPGTTVEVVASDLSTVEKRAEYRAKLAAEMKFDEILHDAHPKGGTTLDFDSKVSDDGDHVEDLVEQHSAMMDSVTSPVAVRKEAETIDRYVKEGKVDPRDLDKLVEAGLDKDAVAYWKKYYSQVDGGSEFAGELVKEHQKKAAEEALSVEKVKLARAYELSHEMVERGLCNSDRMSVSAKVDELMKLNDDGFDSMKRLVAKAPAISRTASLPNVGYVENHLVSNASAEPQKSLIDELTAALGNSKPLLF